MRRPTSKDPLLWADFQVSGFKRNILKVKGWMNIMLKT